MPDIVAAKENKARFDFSAVDPASVNPDTIDLGTTHSDCALIAQTFERGAHATPTETAVFATISRTLQNNKAFAQAASNEMSTYLAAPEDSAKAAAAQASKYANAGASIPGGGGASAPTSQFLQSLNIALQKQATHGDDFGDKLMGQLRDCIPCDLRLNAFLELQPNIDLLGGLEKHLLAQLGVLSDITGLLNNLDSYADLCELLKLLSFMCPADLQRIIAMLMAMFTLQIPEFDGLIGLLQSLVMPIFAPILLAISQLLDKFTLFITNPLKCVLDAITKQLKSLNFEQLNNSTGTQLQSAVNASQEALEKASSQLNKADLSSGMKQLQKQVQDGIQTIQRQLNFYIEQIKAMMGELGDGDSAYLQAKLQTLQLIRMIAFVKAIISALAQGHAACSNTGQNPEASEIDNFFQNFLNPQSPFNLSIDDDGQLHIDDSKETAEVLKEFGNVLQFEGSDLLHTTVSQKTKDITTALTTPIQVVSPCRLETSVSDVQKINQWITELS